MEFKSIYIRDYRRINKHENIHIEIIPSEEQRGKKNVKKQRTESQVPLRKKIKNLNMHIVEVQGQVEETAAAKKQTNKQKKNTLISRQHQAE